MFAPALKRGPDGVLAGVPFFLGPEILGGAFVELARPRRRPAAPCTRAPAEGRGLFGASLDLAYALSPSFQLESQLGNLRVVPGGAGTVLLSGATLGAARPWGASYRF